MIGHTEAAKDAAARALCLASPKDRALARRAAQIALARVNVSAFIEYAIPHEEDGRVVVNAPHHLQWQDVLTHHRRAVIMAPVEHAKTQQIAIGRVLWEIGTNPNLRLALISNTADQAEKLLLSIRRHIDTNELVRDVFPHLRRSEVPGDPWHQTQITVQRSTLAKDPTVQARGVTGPINGSRLDGAILDDVVDLENSRTPEQIDKVLQWFDSTLFQRLGEHAFCWIIGTPWNQADLLHTLAARPSFYFAHYSAVTNPDDDPENWEPIWFSKKRLIDVYHNITPHNFARKYLCRVRVDATSRFQKAWIDRCLAEGRGRTLLDRAPVSAGGKRLACFTGVDLGVGQEEQHDLTVLFTIAVDDRGRRIVVDIQSGRWQAPEIISRIYDVQRRYGSIVTVESNGAQRFLLQFAGAQGLSVKSFQTTAKNKYDEAFGVETLAVEMRAGMWVIPSGVTGQEIDGEVRQWINEMLFYTPEGHSGDRLMASWFARESARDSRLPAMQKLDTIRR